MGQPCLRWLVLMTRENLYISDAEEWHDNLRKSSEIFGKITFLAQKQGSEIAFIYNIKISTIENLALSRIALSLPCKPGYKHFIFSILKLSFACFLFISPVSDFYNFRYMWRHRVGTRHEFTIDYSRNCPFLWKCRAIPAQEVSFISSKRYSRVSLKRIDNHRIRKTGMLLQRQKGAGLIRVLLSMSQNVLNMALSFILVNSKSIVLIRCTLSWLWFSPVVSFLSLKNRKIYFFFSSM